MDDSFGLAIVGLAMLASGIWAFIYWFLFKRSSISLTTEVVGQAEISEREQDGMVRYIYPPKLKVVDDGSSYPSEDLVGRIFIPHIHSFHSPIRSNKPVKVYFQAKSGKILTKGQDIVFRLLSPLAALIGFLLFIASFGDLGLHTNYITNSFVTFG